MLVYVLFYLGQLSHFLSCFGAGVTNLNEPPSSFLLPPHYCGLGAGSIPFRAIANNKQCEMRGLFMSLVIHYWIGDVQDCHGVSASKMTYIVSSGALNSTHSLIRVSITFVWLVGNRTRIYVLVFTVQDSQGVSTFEMTYIVTVSDWALSSTHSLKSVGYWCMIPSCQISLLHFLATYYG